MLLCIWQQYPRGIAMISHFLAFFGIFFIYSASFLCNPAWLSIIATIPLEIFVFLDQDSNYVLWDLIILAHVCNLMIQLQKDLNNFNRENLYLLQRCMTVSTREHRISSYTSSKTPYSYHSAMVSSARSQFSLTMLGLSVTNWWWRQKPNCLPLNQCNNCWHRW